MAHTKPGQDAAPLEARVELVCLFSPEHGLSAKGADGQAQADTWDAITGLPIRSLYGTQLKPDLSELDGLIFDLPDIGLRFYPYIWTLSHLMECCEEAGKQLLALDRINPLSGRLELVEGPYLDPALSSFIGRWRIPIRHSLTVGELAAYWQDSRGMHSLSLEIIPCTNWQRKLFFAIQTLHLSPLLPGQSPLKTSALVIHGNIVFRGSYFTLRAVHFLHSPKKTNQKTLAQ